MKAIPRLCFLLAALPLLAKSAPTRVANTSLNLPGDLPSGTYSTVNAFPGLTFTDPVAIVTAPGETNRLFVVEKAGLISLIPDLSAPTREVFLDISSAVRGNPPPNEEGFLGLAFHPNYNNVGATGFGQFFVYYMTNVNSQRHWRLSRFSVNPSDPDLADPTSEVPLITQRDQAGNHNGGDLHFGNDGYLYISVGDEGGANDTWDNGQHIDKDFFSAIFRIDVDQSPGNLVPNSHAAVHANTYRVPADNPFVGATTFNGLAVNSADVRTEIWAIGLRNPWRMSFDRPTGRLFVADVGQGSREEINILDQATFDTNGGVPNYGWSYREGFLAFTSGPGGATPPPGFSHIDPIHDYPRSLGQSVTGGLVYRGSQYPELTGDYLFTDYISGRIWAMDDPGGPSQSVTEMANDNNIAGFGLNPATGDILMGDLGSDSIKRLVRTTGAGTQPPQFLSQTGAFSNVTSLTPETGILPYSINVPFWSDRAEKTRWFSIPDLADDMVHLEDGNWTFPEGQVWIKHFELELNRDSPGADRRRVETRFLVKTFDDVYGITYRWNAAQTDAELVVEDGDTVDFTVTEGGNTRTQTWIFPSRNDCRTCHNQTAGGALSFNTRQLNRVHDYGMGDENQLEALEMAGYFSNPVPDAASLPEFSAPGDESASLEERARSFLSVNCISCHQEGGSALGEWDARPWLTLEESGILDSPLSNSGGDPHARTLVPGDPQRSMILQRLLAAESPGPLPQMPPLGSNEPNVEGIALIESWIGSMSKILFVRGADRSGGFSESGNDASRTEHLGDINNTTTGSGNHGWGELAATLRDEGFLLEQITETAENSSGPSQGIHIDFETLNLDQYRTIVFGSNNATYDTAAIDAIDDWIRGGGSALFISDANFGGNWADAANSDQHFLDRFGLIMNQDRGTYAKTRSAGEFLDPNHPIFENVDEFHGEGVSPISIGMLPGDVSATVLAGAEGQVRRNTPPYGTVQGPSTAANANDGALLVATAGAGKIAGHYDRNTFFNDGGVGSDITRFDNEQYAINLFHWLAEPVSPDPIPTGLSATDGLFPDRIELDWIVVAEATGYTVYRNTVDDFGTSISIGTPSSNSFTDNTADYGTSYHYWVTSTVDATESAPSLSAQGSRLLTAPTGLTASDGTHSDRVAISWNAVSGASGYVVYRAETNDFGTATPIATPASTSHDDTLVSPATTYYYWVTATADSNESGPTGSNTGYAGLTAPTGVTASDGTSSDNITLAWSSVSGATAYRVYRNTSNNSGSASRIVEVLSNSYVDASAALIGGRTYYYWISTVVDSLESSFGVVETGYKSISSVTGLTAANGLSPTGVALAWNATTDASAFEVYRSTTNAFISANLIGTVGTNSYFDQSALNGTNYFYWVVATNAYGSGAPPESVQGLRRIYNYQPDLLTGKSTTKFEGNNVYGNGTPLKISEKQRRPITGYLRIQNDGETTDQLRLSGPKKNKYFKIKYVRLTPSGANITALVSRNQYVSGNLAAGSSEVVRATVNPTRATKRSKRSRKFIVSADAASVTLPTAGDRISIKVISKK